MHADRIQDSPRPATGSDKAGPAWSREEFEAKLRERGRSYHIHHPFNVMLNSGRATPEQIRGWVANRFYYQIAIPIKDAAVLSNCPDQQVRRGWVQRILDHDGFELGGIKDEGGVEAWLRLAEAVGLTREEVRDLRHLVPAVRFAVDAYVDFARRKPWIEAVASSLTELFGPGAIRVRLAALEAHYPWIDPAGLQYFRDRLVQAPRDADYALRLVVDRCVTREQQERAVAALKFKTEMLWAQLEAIERGDTQPPAVP